MIWIKESNNIKCTYQLVWVFFLVNFVSAIVRWWLIGEVFPFLLEHLTRYFFDLESYDSSLPCPVQIILVETWLLLIYLNHFAVTRNYLKPSQLNAIILIYCYQIRVHLLVSPRMQHHVLVLIHLLNDFLLHVSYFLAQ